MGTDKKERNTIEIDSVKPALNQSAQETQVPQQAEISVFKFVNVLAQFSISHCHSNEALKQQYQRRIPTNVLMLFNETRMVQK